MRIGINVPDELLERIKPLKEITNVSLICREAIKASVEAYERATAQAMEDSMEAVADRLSQEHVSQEVDWEALGISDAKIWVESATLKDFQYLFKNLSVSKQRGEPVRVDGGMPAFLSNFGTVFAAGATFHHRKYEHKEWFWRQYELDETVNHHERANAEYDRGWLCYVAAVWQMVEKRMAAAERARQAAREGSRAKVELPDQLERQITARFSGTGKEGNL